MKNEYQYSIVAFSKQGIDDRVVVLSLGVFKCLEVLARKRNEEPSLRDRQFSV